jgi:hypothetical protein
VYAPHRAISIKLLRPSVNIVRARAIGPDAVMVVILDEVAELIA